VAEVDAVVIRDVSSGRYHRAARIGTSLASPEGCNRDQAGAYEVLEELPPDVDFGELCKRCFKPEPEPDTDTVPE
jgi:hypothetical protein